MKYNTVELLEIAISLEKEGAEFYNTIANSVSSTESKNLFMEFAGDEKKHEAIFLELKKTTDIFVDSDEDDTEMPGLIEQITRRNILPGIPVGKIEDFHPLTAIKLAVQTEKNTIEFYKKLLKRIKSNESRTLIKTLIEEEKHHLNKLTELHKNKTFSF